MTKSKRLVSLFTIFAIVFTMAFATIDFTSASSKSDKYWLKVNTQRNVVTAYKYINSKWVPVRAMVCSTGLSPAKTPHGTFYSSSKIRWGTMMGNVYAQYCTRITGSFLFHSVYYWTKGRPDTQVVNQYTKLGYDASHGCVRLSVMDAKWIYENCKRGTKVSVYDSSKLSVLGKPSRNKAKAGKRLYWDPTDPNPNNPYFVMKKPKIKISSSKKLSVKEGANYSLLSGVSAKDPNTNMNLTSYLKVRVRKYSSTTGKYDQKVPFSTKNAGSYKVTYSVNDPYGRYKTKTVYINVKHNLEPPTITGASNKTVSVNSTNAISGVSAKQKNMSRTEKIITYITKPGSQKAIALKYTTAKAYKFTKIGKYTIKYVVRNAYSPYKATKKTVYYTVTCDNVTLDAPASISVNKGSTLNLQDVSATQAQYPGKNINDKITATVTRPSNTKTSSLKYSTLTQFKFIEVGEYKVTLTIVNPYKASNKLTKTIIVNCK